ncbi:MAG: hypothetical protein K8R41_09315 [Bacteroidales bacterium]|nr:hypothetical protein [Bacteroidales bacterium]
MKKVKNRISVSKILLEIISVSFAVLLALGVNEWRNIRANERLANEALENIRKEILSNLDIAKETLTLNKEIVKKQKVAFLSIKKEIDSNIPNSIENDVHSRFPFSFKFSPTKKTAWNSSNLTNAVTYLDFDLVQLLSETYETQELYSRVNENILERLFSPGLFMKKTISAELQAYFMKLKMYFQVTESLIDDYELCLKEIKEHTE